MTPTLTHPAWCDPRSCVSYGADLEHRDLPTVWTVPDNVTLSVGRSQLDNPGLGDVDHVHVRLSLDDGDNAVAVELHPSDVDALGFALLRRRLLIAPGPLVLPALIACGRCGKGSGHWPWCELA